MQALLQFSALIEDDYERPIAVVEAQNLSDREIAIEWRGNMLRWGLPEHVPYVLLLSKDLGFLWKDKPSLSADSPPDYEFPMQSVIARYSKKQPEELTWYSYEWDIVRWLMHLSFNPGDVPGQPEETLARAGFLNAIKDTLVLKGDPK